MDERKDEINKGIFVDDSGIGGARTKGVKKNPSSDAPEVEDFDHEAITQAEAITMTWFDLLIEVEDKQPTARTKSGSIQIEKTDIKDLYAEYVAWGTDAEGSTGALFVSPDDMLSMAQWRKVWLGNYPHLVIRVTKNVSSKDMVRPRLRAMMRERRGRSREFLLKIKTLRATYRKTIGIERMYYYTARTYAIMNPQESMTTISDGASQACVFYLLCALSLLRCYMLHFIHQ